MSNIEFELNPLSIADIVAMAKYFSLMEIHFNGPEQWTLFVQPDVTITLWPITRKCQIETQLDQLPEQVLRFKSAMEWVPDPRFHVVDVGPITDTDAGNA